MRASRLRRRAATAAGFMCAWLAAPAHAGLGGAPMTPPAADTAAPVRSIQRSIHAAGGASAAASKGWACGAGPAGGSGAACADVPCRV